MIRSNHSTSSSSSSREDKVLHTKSRQTRLSLEEEEEETEHHALLPLEHEQDALIPHNNITDHHDTRTKGISEWQAGVSLAKAIMGKIRYAYPCVRYEGSSPFPIFYGSVGAGGFALPWAFRQLGYLAGPLILAILTSVSLYALQLLLECAARVKTHNNHIQSYVGIAQSIFGTAGARWTYAASISASLGVCGSYLVFIAANLQSLWSTTSPSLSETTLILATLPVAIALSLVQDMKHFAFTSLLGNVSVILGMLVVLIYGFFYHSNSNDNHKQDSEDSSYVAVGDIQDFSLALGTMGFLFLVHFLVMPIQSSMERPACFFSVAQWVFTSMALVCGVFGILGYVLFGNQTQQIVLLNVQEGSVFVSDVQLLLCIDLLLTYPVVMRPSIVIVEQSLSNNIIRMNRPKSASRNTSPTTGQSNPGGGQSSFPASETPALPAQAVLSIDQSQLLQSTNHSTADNSNISWTLHFFVCTFLGCLAAAGGIFVPAFGVLSGLVGGVSQTFLALVLPPLMRDAQRRQDETTRTTMATLTMTTRNHLPLRLPEVGLVGLGLVLIVWTLISTWNELSTY